MFDYGRAGNMIKYGIVSLKLIKLKSFLSYHHLYTRTHTHTHTHTHTQPTPPQYNLTNLHIPTAIFTGDHDWLADPKDVKNLIPKIRRVLINHTDIPSYEHLDFIWGLSAPELVYSVVMELARKYL